jgi:hypothetical protein
VSSKKHAVLVTRGGCDFVTKALHLQAVGAAVGAMIMGAGESLSCVHPGSIGFLFPLFACVHCCIGQSSVYIRTVDVSFRRSRRLPYADCRAVC